MKPGPRREGGFSPRRVLVAPDSFKGCLSAPEVAAAIAAGLQSADPSLVVRSLPIADGGEGTVDTLLAALGGRRHWVRVKGPLGAPVRTAFGVLPDGQTAVLETASACGLALVDPARRDALRASSRGLGELLRAALDAGARRVLLGLGGSATSDGGAGLAAALGVRLLDRDGCALTEGGGELRRLARIEAAGLDSRLRTGVRLEGLVDVNNPLLGPRGAARLFAPQKGAGPREVALLEQGLTRLATRLRADLGRRVADRPGAAAAGGIGAGLMGFFRARLVSGIGRVLQLVEFDRWLQQTDCVITGEGSLDGQSLGGKAPLGVARAARVAGIPAVALVGRVSVAPGRLRREGIRRTIAVSNASDEEQLRPDRVRAELFAAARALAAEWRRARQS